MDSLPLVEIKQVHGNGLTSPLSGDSVRLRGLVTSVLRRGFYLQTPFVEWDRTSSDAIFVYSKDWLPELGYYLEVSGEVVDYLKHETAKPVTQLKLDQVRRLSLEIDDESPDILTPVRFEPDWFPANDNAKVASLLNSLEGMLVEIPAGMTFIAPSNAHGDYVLNFAAEQAGELRSAEGGVLISAANPDRWYPGFRIYDYRHANKLNVGSTLLSAVRGALHYRVDSWQVASNHPFEFEPASYHTKPTRLVPDEGEVTIMTLNCFNLDPHVESADKVLNPRQDVDDDWGEGRFHSLARAITHEALCPDIVALQEIQDNDGAEQTAITDADDTYRMLVKCVHAISGIEYQWVDIDPVLGADGGQPGGNIRNGYLYNPQRVSLDTKSVTTLGNESEAFVDSRKPLVATFRELDAGAELVCINVHLASKRHQNSIFAPIDPGVDAKLGVRVAQAEIITSFAEAQLALGKECYITGDFNDTEHSETLATITQGSLSNLVGLLPNHERYDYNHRGKLQILMHGLVSNAMAAERAEYEIIHGNELVGVTPGEDSDKPSDHAYVIARLRLVGNS